MCDVAAHDGLNNEPRVLAPVLRAELVRRLVASGLRRVEVTSFVDDARVPAMAVAEEVAGMIPRRPGVTYAGLVRDERGYERLRRAGLDEARMVVACTDAFGRRTAKVSQDDAAASAERVITRARADGLRVVVTLAVAFGCPYEGRTPPHRVLALAERLGLAVDELILADTVGVAAPAEVRRLVGSVVGLGATVGVHLHDTRNTAVANVYAALEAGAVVVDAAVGGTGRCPFSAGAAGNLATEELVYALERDGIGTGVDLDRLVGVAAWLAELLDHPLAGRAHRVGVPEEDPSEAVTLFPVSGLQDDRAGRAVAGAGPGRA